MQTWRYLAVAVLNDDRVTVDALPVEAVTEKDGETATDDLAYTGVVDGGVAEWERDRQLGNASKEAETGRRRAARDKEKCTFLEKNSSLAKPGEKSSKGEGFWHTPTQ